MQLRPLSKIIVLLIGLFASSLVFSLGLGDITLKSSYNEPLNAEIRLLQPQEFSESEILLALASNEDFSRVGLDRDFFLTGFKFTVVLDDRDNAYVKVTSRQPVQEPYLNFLVDMQWPSGRLLREYTILLDLPLFEGESVAAAPINVPQVDVVNESAPAPKVQEVIEPVEKAPEQLKVNSPEPAVIEPAPARDLASRSDSFSELDDAANSFIKTLSRQAAERQSSFEVQPEASSVNQARKKVAVVEETSDAAPVQRQVQRQVAQEQPAATPTNSGSTPSDLVEVQSGDTLWALALKMRPNRSVSVQQTMVAIQQANPAAFIGDNINLLRKGQVLRAPTLSEIQRTNVQEAIAAVKQQTQTWKQQSQQAPVISAVSPDLNVPAKPTPQEGRVTLGSADASNSAAAIKGTGQSGSGESLQNELAIVQEELDKSSRENSNLKSKISDLENQIQTLEDLVSLTNDQLKALELTTDKNNSVGTEDSATEVAVASNDVDNTSDAAVTNEAAVETNNTDGSVSIIQQVVNTIVSNLLYIAIGLLLVLLLVWFFITRSKDQVIYDEDDFELDSDLAPLEDELEEGFVNEGEELYDLDELSEEPSINDPVVEAQTEDVIAEADIYIELGQVEKAEELLQKEIQQNPENANARLALLGLYTKSQNAEAFDDQYAQLLPLGDQVANDKAKALRKDLNTENEFDVSSYSLDDNNLENADDLVGDFSDLDADDSDSLFDELDVSDDLDASLDVAPLDAEELASADDLLAVDDDEEFLSELASLNTDDDALSLGDDHELQADNSLDLNDKSDSSSDLDEELLADLLSGEDESSDTDIAAIENESLEIASDEGDLTDLSDDLFDLDLDDELLDNAEDLKSVELESLESESLELESLEKDDELGLDFDLLDAEIEDDSSPLDDQSNDTTVLSENELDAFLDENEDKLDVSFDGGELEDAIDDEGDLDLDLLDLDDMSSTANVVAPESDGKAGDDLDSNQAVDNEMSAGDESDAAKVADENEIDLDIDYTDLDLSDIGDSVIESEESADAESDASDLEEDIFAESLDDEIDLEQAQSVVAESSDFDLDLPPADLDMASLDKELDEMTAMFDEDLDTDTDIEDGLDEAVEQMVEEEELEIAEVSPDNIESEAIAPVAEEDDTDFETDEDEVGTKLDLAQAYIDMGDMDGAEDILQEVVEEGSAEQKSAAEKLLQSL
jgi:pilus assembly protein FimV